MKKVFMLLFVLVVSSHCLWGAKAPADVLSEVEGHLYGQGSMPEEIKSLIQNALDGDAKNDMLRVLNRFNKKIKFFSSTVRKQEHFVGSVNLVVCRHDQAALHADLEGRLPADEGNGNSLRARLSKYFEAAIGYRSQLVEAQGELVALGVTREERDRLREQLGQANERVASLEEAQQGFEAAEASWGQEKGTLAGQIVTLTAVKQEHEKCPKPGVWEKNQAAIKRLEEEKAAQAAAARQSAETLIAAREKWDQEREGLKGQIRDFEEASPAVSVTVPQNVWSKTQKKQLVAVGVGAAVVSSAATAAAIRYWSRNPGRS